MWYHYLKQYEFFIAVIAAAERKIMKNSYLQKLLSLFLAFVLCLSFVACQNQAENSESEVSESETESVSDAIIEEETSAVTIVEPDESESEAESEIEEIPEEPDTTLIANEKTNLLTGLDTLTEGGINKRPIALSVNNISDSWPQYGISDADIIFEIPVEYNITRLMALYGDFTQVKNVLSIRSCRYYYPILAEGFDAQYIHCGMDEVHARGIINELGIKTYDAGSDPLGVFARDQDRINSGYAYEHTLYFRGEKYAEKAEASENWRTDLAEDHIGKLAFKFSTEAVIPEGEACTELSVDFGSGYYSDFHYNAEEEVYYKDHNGTKHMDVGSGLQLSFDNLFFLETDIHIFEGDTAGRKEIDIYADRYKGYYVTKGQIIEIMWTKSSASEQLLFETMDGEELMVNTGKTYIAVCLPDSETFA